MRILHIIPYYYPAFKSGGPVESVHLLNKALVKKGINVSVITTFCGIENKSNIKTNQWINHEGVRVKYFPLYLYYNYAFSPQLLLAVLKELKNYDLVHMTSIWNFPVLVSYINCILFKKPYMISPRGSLYQEAVEIKSRRLKKFYYHLIAKHYMTQASGIHFTTEDERNKTADYVMLPKQSFIIPNGLDLDPYKRLPEKGLFVSKFPILKNKKYILFLGRVAKRKGIHILIEAFQELVKDYKDLFLVIAGPDEGGYLEEIKKY